MTVYLIHFDRPIGNPDTPHGMARHYMGYTENLERRLAGHRAGNGSRLMAAVAERGIGWTVARVWPDGDRDLERRLKRRKKHRRLCPICRGEVEEEDAPDGV